MPSDASTLVLETARLRLRHLSLDDLDPLAEIQADAEVMRYFTSGPRSREEVRAELERCIALQAAHGFSLWAAVDRRTGRLVGRCGLLRPDWNLGLGTEAALAIRDHGFDVLGRERLVSIIHRDNLASRRVAEKAGLRAERSIQFMNHRCWLYAIEARDRAG
jgi:ribosomal-protein-alanine N-acetyltransferase